MTKDICLNCGSIINGDFCEKCGQRTSLGRITFKETFQNFLSSTFALEGPLLFTVRKLIINPGSVFREYTSGKRKTYYQPVAFFVVTTAFYIVLRAIIGFDPLEGQADPVTDDQENSLAYVQAMEAARFMVDNINNIMFVLVFSIGLILKIFYWRRYYLAEYVVMGFYIAGFYILFGTILMFIKHYLNIETNQVQLAVLVMYIFFSAFSLFRKTTFLAFTKYTVISLLSLASYIILGFSLSYLIVILR